MDAASSAQAIANPLTSEEINANFAEAVANIRPLLQRCERVFEHFAPERWTALRLVVLRAIRERVGESADIITFWDFLTRLSSLDTKLRHQQILEVVGRAAQIETWAKCFWQAAEPRLSVKALPVTSTPRSSEDVQVIIAALLRHCPDADVGRKWLNDQEHRIEAAIPEPASGSDKIVPNAAVEVVKSLCYVYDTDPRLNYNLVVGQKGVVCQVDGGDALIDFHGVGRRWLLRADLASIRLLEETQQTTLGEHTAPVHQNTQLEDEETKLDDELDGEELSQSNADLSGEQEDESFAALGHSCASPDFDDPETTMFLNDVEPTQVDQLSAIEPTQVDQPPVPPSKDFPKVLEAESSSMDGEVSAEKACTVEDCGENANPSMASAPRADPSLDEATLPLELLANECDGVTSGKEVPTESQKTHLDFASPLETTEASCIAPLDHARTQLAQPALAPVSNDALVDSKMEASTESPKQLGGPGANRRRLSRKTKVPEEMEDDVGDDELFSEAFPDAKEATAKCESAMEVVVVQDSGEVDDEECRKHVSDATDVLQQPPASDISGTVAEALSPASVGHTLRPAQQGMRVAVVGDGWGGGSAGYEAVITEADSHTYTVVKMSGPGTWSETHVLKKYTFVLESPQCSNTMQHPPEVSPVAEPLVSRLLETATPAKKRRLRKTSPKSEPKPE